MMWLIQSKGNKQINYKHEWHRNADESKAMLGFDFYKYVWLYCHCYQIVYFLNTGNITVTPEFGLFISAEKHTVLILFVLQVNRLRKLEEICFLPAPYSQIVNSITSTLSLQQTHQIIEYNTPGGYFLEQSGGCSRTRSS